MIDDVRLMWRHGRDWATFSCVINPVKLNLTIHKFSQFSFSEISQDLIFANFMICWFLEYIMIYEVFRQTMTIRYLVSGVWMSVVRVFIFIVIDTLWILLLWLDFHTMLYSFSSWQEVKNQKYIFKCRKRQLFIRVSELVLMVKT